MFLVLYVFLYSQVRVSLDASRPGLLTTSGGRQSRERQDVGPARNLRLINQLMGVSSSTFTATRCTFLCYSVGLCSVLILNRDAPKACCVNSKVSVRGQNRPVRFSSEESSFRSGEVGRRSGATSSVAVSGQTLPTASFPALTGAASLLTSQPQPSSRSWRANVTLKKRTFSKEFSSTALKGVLSCKSTCCGSEGKNSADLM